ncbi:MAG: ATP-binding protein, partial [Gammaproteobacteria bacterium]|nr:ATP-binding protein [Gammaproteobacteria bacterium]
ITSLFMQRKTTLLFAATTTLLILADQTYSQLLNSNFDAAFVQTGILGTLLFIFAFITSGFSRQLRETEKLASEQEYELETITQLNEHIISSMRTGIIVLSHEGSILMSNRAAEDLLGKTKLRQHMHLQNIAPELYQRFAEWQLSDNKPQQTPIHQSHGLPDLQPGFSPIEKNKTKSLTLVFLEDASQLNQRFQQIRLASLGRLTASIAHEIRNPLAAIQHASQLLEESIDHSADQKLAHIITTHTQRLNDVVKNVLQLSRKQQGIPDTICLNNWLIAFRNEFCPTYGMTEQQIKISINPETLTIIFDPEQLHQIFWNLCSNSINHSGIDSHQLLITINGWISADDQQPIIEIMDNGQGIDEKIATQIFEPFYTTSTEGTGLGLYIIKEIVENNHAKIELVNQQGGNSCFRVHFMQADSQSINR